MLLTVVLLVAASGVRCQKAEDFVTDKIFYEGHLGLRVVVAHGGVKLNGKEYGPASNMYKLVKKSFLEALAKSVLDKKITSLPGSFGRNDYTSRIASGTNITVEAMKALGYWSKSDSSLNQMILSRATQIGCAHKLTNIDGEENMTTLDMICLYDRKYTKGEPYTKGPPCEKDSECTTYTPSTCDTKYKLCEKK